MSPRRLERRPSLESLVERVDQRRPGEISGDTIPSGFPSVDRVLGSGLRRRDLVVLGGDIGSGKSALALGLAFRVARQGLGVAFFSGEMDEERLMERALAIEGRVAVDELRSAKLNEQTRAGIGGAAVRLRGLPLAALAGMTCQRVLLGPLPAGEAARLWLYGTARRVVANQQRGKRRRERLTQRIQTDVGHEGEPCRVDDSLGAVAAAFARLRADDRELLALVAWEGLDAREVAQVCGCSRNAARIRIHRARRRFAHKLARVGGSVKQNPVGGHVSEAYE